MVDRPQADQNTDFLQALLVGPPACSGDSGHFKVMPVIGTALKYENRQKKQVVYSRNLQ